MKSEKGWLWIRLLSKPLFVSIPLRMRQRNCHLGLFESDKTPDNLGHGYRCAPVGL